MEALVKVDIQGNVITNKWQAENTPADWKEGNFIPTFNIAPVNKKFGPEGKQMSAKVLAIDCKASDAEYLKTIFTE
eukprot:907743-Ditylum_brightwellii.AAC.1